MLEEPPSDCCIAQPLRPMFSSSLPGEYRATTPRHRTTPLLPLSRRRGVEEGQNSGLVAADHGASSRVAVTGKRGKTRAGRAR